MNKFINIFEHSAGYLLLENCMITMVGRDIHPDYIFSVPPDYSELSLNPKKDQTHYDSFLCNIFTECARICDVVTVALTDRKFNGTIIPKHFVVMEHFLKRLNMTLISHKIWMKSPKINLFRLNYLNVMTFAKNKVKQNHPKEFEYDVYNVRDVPFRKFPYGMPVDVVKWHIQNFTKEGQVVYDPFMGSGTTAIACMESKRKYIGSEISKSVFDLSIERIKIKSSSII